MGVTLEWSGVLSGSLILAVLTSAAVFAQGESAKTEITSNGPADPGFVSGSPWLWLLFVVICVIMVFAYLRRKRNT